MFKKKKRINSAFSVYSSSSNSRLWLLQMTGQSCPISCMLQSLLLPWSSHVFPTVGKFCCEGKKPEREWVDVRNVLEVCFYGDSFIRGAQEPRIVPYIRMSCLDSAEAYQFVKVWGQNWSQSKRPQLWRTDGEWRNGFLTREGLQWTLTGWRRKFCLERLLWFDPCMPP